MKPYGVIMLRFDEGPPVNEWFLIFLINKLVNEKYLIESKGYLC